MRSVFQGSRGAEVIYLQRLLNRQNVGKLREDGIFGPKTRAALVAWKTAKHRPPSPVADQGTFMALGMRAIIEHPVQMIPQPTNMSCWAASMAMILGNRQMVGPGNAIVNPTGDLRAGPNNVSQFANTYGMRLLSSMANIGVDQILNWLRRGPLMVIGASSDGAGGLMAHASVISAIYSDQEADGKGTVLRIHDPWPPNRGEVYGVVFTGDNQAVSGLQYSLFTAFVVGK